MFFLKQLINLEKLDFRGNPVEKLPKFHDHCIITTRRLQWIDNKEVSETERKYLIGLMHQRETKI
jgi:hypothetical protein